MMRIKERKGVSQYVPLYAMALPGLLYLLINNYIPMIGVVIAFKDVNFAKGILASEWVGLKNFEYLFATSDAWTITRNTILYNLAFIAINTIIAIILAILLNEIKSKAAARFYQAVVLLPMLISMVIVSYLVLSFLDGEKGFLNKTVLPWLRMDPVSWYSEPGAWPFIIPIVNLWKGVGFGVIVYYASIIGIDRELYEAATIDGAGAMRKALSITLPLLTPVIIMTTTIAIGRIFYSDFGLFFQVPLDSGALYDATNTIDTYVYRGLMKLGDIGMSSAASLYQAFVGFVLIIGSNAIVRKISSENALF